jgi:hypothetical protein
MSGNIPDKDKKELCLKSGNRCAFPNCHRILVVDDPINGNDSIVAVMAHIKGEKPGAARYDDSLPEKERNKYDNLILICPTCHKIIDDQENIYTIEKLYKIKQEHENWIFTLYEEETPKLTFVELAEVMRYISESEVSLQQSYEVITPKEKILKNNLSSQVEGLLVMGLTKATMIKEYLNSHPEMQFADKLVNGFIKEYKRLKFVEQLKADDLFFALLDFASCYKTEFIYRAAGLAVLSYLFEKCEVFEK